MIVVVVGGGVVVVWEHIKKKKDRQRASHKNGAFKSVITESHTKIKSKEANNTNIYNNRETHALIPSHGFDKTGLIIKHLVPYKYTHTFVNRYDHYH